ncbi:MAG: transcriptional regulator [Bacteroidetes bacterium]|nr:MAG: transcriptional regulator [Bacteroidota bacterium]
MRNPEITKKTILKEAGILFNTQGYKATSISEIATATGFTKGAIYRHFNNKDELELETLTYLTTIMLVNVRDKLKQQHTAGDKLRAVFRYFESYVTQPDTKGGCPLLNAAVEADDAHPALRKGALKILNLLRESVMTILDNGIKHKQLKPGIDKEMFATVAIASLEGAIMMSKLHGNNDDIRRVIKHLEKLLNEIEN